MMNILHISDIHYRKKYIKYNNIYEQMLFNMGNPLINLKKCLIEVYSKYKIDLILISGDLCDSGKVEEYKELKKFIDNNVGNIPYVVTLGNHDIKENFEEGWGIKLNNGLLLSTFDICDYKIISFDNSEYDNSLGVLDEFRVNWLRETLLQSKKPTILLMHHHLHNHAGVPPIEYSEEFESLIKTSNIFIICCGHTHSAFFSTFANKSYFVGNSMSFRGENNRDNTVCFKEIFGYCVYEIEKDKVSKIHMETLSNDKLLSVWNFNKQYK